MIFMPQASVGKSQAAQGSCLARKAEESEAESLVPGLHGGIEDLCEKQNVRTFKCHKEPDTRSTWSGVLPPGVSQECPDREERGTRGVMEPCTALPDQFLS